MTGTNPGCNVGIRGVINQTGLGTDGSFYYTDVVLGKAKRANIDIHFSDTKSRIDKGINRFEYGTSASQAHLEQFIALLESIKTQNVKIILFFPPLAPEIVDHMAGYEYGYIQDLKAKLSAAGVSFLDFTDPRKLLKTSHCEFIDGFHPGDVLAAQILQYITEHEPSLKSYVSTPLLDKVTKDYSGLAMIPDAKVTTEPEVDFLELGCSKTALQPSHTLIK